MAITTIGVNDAITVKRWSASLAVDVGRESYFQKKMMGKGDAARTPIQILTELESQAGDKITYDLSMQLGMVPIQGDATLEGNEEDLKFYTDGVFIDQARGAVNTGGRMTHKRTLHDLREVAKQRHTEWWARVFDEEFFVYLSGARGANTDFIYPTNWTGRATNALAAPDAEHLLYGGAATSKASLAATDKFTLSLVDKAVARASMMGGGTTGTPQIQPVRIDGEERYVVVMNPWQAYDLRTNTSTGQWLDIQKAAAGAEGRDNPMFKGSLGMYNNVILHEHKAVIRFADYGSGGDVATARALFLGSQAGVVAFGSPGTGLRFGWHEELFDHDNQVAISTSAIYGIKKARFNSKDFGVIALDTAAKDPTA